MLQQEKQATKASAKSGAMKTTLDMNMDIAKGGG